MIVGKLRGILQNKKPQDRDKSFNEFEQILRSAKQVNQTDINILLRKAIQYSTPNFSKYYNLLVNHNVNVNYYDNKDHKTNLMIACQIGTPEIVEILLTNSDIKVEQEDNLKNTALIYAINCKSKQDRYLKTKIILEKHPQLIPYKGNNIKNILNMCIEKNSQDLLKLLLQKGQPPNALFADGMTALFPAVKQLNSKDRKDFKQMVRLLLKYGANPEIKDRRGKSVYDFASDRVKQFIQQQLKIIQNQKQMRDCFQRQRKIREQETCYLQINTPNQIQDLALQARQFYQKNKQKIINRRKLQQISQFWSDPKNFESDEQQQQASFTQQYIASTQFVTSLSEEIKQYDNECYQEYMNSFRQFKEFYQYFSQCMKQKNLDVEIYGSFATGLWLKHCDIDLLLIPNNGVPNYKPEQILAEAQISLQKRQNCKNIILNKKVKVPMLRFEIKEKNRDKTRKVDITVYNSQHNGQKSIKMITNFMDNLPTLRPLFYIIKSLTYHYRLNDPKNKGIRSYAVIVMLYNFLYHRNHLDIKLGQLLIEFLNYFGFIHNYQFMYQSNEICLNIVDPLNYNNNIGNSSNALGLQNMFRAAFIALHTNVKQKRLSFLWETKKLFSQQLKK